MIIPLAIGTAALGAVLAAGVGDEASPVRIVASSFDRVVIEADWRGVTVRRDATGTLRVDGANLQRTMAVGMPDLPYAAVTVALPPRGGFEIACQPSEVTTHAGVAAVVTDTTYAGVDRAPETWYRVQAQGWLRHQRVMTLALYPAIPGVGGLQAARALTVELRFATPGGGETIDDPSFEPVYRVVANAAQGLRWRARPPVTLRKDPTPAPANAVKIYVDRRGICALAGADIQEAGANLSELDPSTFRLSCRGEDVPFLFTGQANAILPGDSIVFFGHPAYRESSGCRLVDWLDHFTAANVYWLSWGGVPGVRFTDRVAAPSGSHPVVDWHTAVAHAEEDLTAFLSNSGDAPWPTEWFWKRWVAGAAGVTQNFDLMLSSPRATQTSLLLRASLHGYTNLANVAWQHHTEFTLNGHVLSDVYWGQGSGRIPFCYDTSEQGVTIDPSWIVAGANRLSVQLLPDIDPEVGPLSSSYFDNWGLRYDRSLSAVQDTLEFAIPPALGPGTWTVRVDDVSSPAALVLDLVRRERLVGCAHAGTVLSFEASTGDSSHFAVATPARFVRPLRVVRERPADPPLASGDGQARYLIIAYDRESVGDQDPYHNLFDAAVDLALARNSAIPTRAIDVQDIYDEFNWGILDPEAIADFLKYAFQTWSPAPEYVLLFGDASWDYLSRYGPNAKRTFVPCWGYPISENYFVQLTDGDIYPDMHIGRLPVEDALQADNAVSKVLSYPSSAGEGVWHKRAVMVVGGFSDEEEIMFEGHAETLLNSYILPAPFLGDASKIYRSLSGYQPGYYNKRITDAISQGCIAVNYIGHGAALTWGIMFDVTDIDSLTNGMAMPVAMGLTCNSSAFGEPDTTTLGEVFLRLRDGEHGAIGFWGATARVSEWAAYNGSREFFDGLCVDLERRVGPLTTAGKIVGGPSVLTMFALLGEPFVALPVATGPDLVIQADSLWITPSIVGENHDVTVRAAVENHGRGSPEPVVIRFAGGPESSEQEIAAIADTCGLRRHTRYAVPWNTGPGVGTRQVSAAADHLNAMTELREDNNSARLVFEALLAPPSVVTPFDCQVVASPSIALSVNDLPQGANRVYEFQIARVDSFTPGAIGFQASGPVPEQAGTTSWWPPGLAHGITYFWRCKAVEGSFDGAWSPTASVTVDSTVGSTLVWAQVHGGQFSADTLAQLVVDRDVHTVLLLAEVNPVDFAHVDQGASVPYVSTYSANPYTDPLNLIGENIGSGAGQYGQFLFANNDYAQEALIDLGQERTIAIVGSEHWIGVDDRPVWSYYRISSSVNNQDFVEWGSLGPFSIPDLDNIPTPMAFTVETPRPARYLRLQFGQGLPHPFPSGALWGSRVYEVFAHAVDFVPSGELLSPVIGPAASWESAQWDAEIPAGTSIALTVSSAAAATGPFTPVDGLANLTSSPASLSGVTAPYVRLRATLATTDPRVSPSLHAWSVTLRGGVDVFFRDGLSLQPEFPVPGTSAQVRGLLINRGNAMADTVRLVVRDSTSVGSFTLADTAFVAVPPGASRSFAAVWTVSQGRHTITARAEVGGASPEVAGDDNTASLTVAILPDPACLALRAVSPQPQQFGEVLLEGTLANLGSVAVDSLLWRFLVRGPDQASSVAADSGTVASLAPAESLVVGITWPGPRSPGIYDCRLTVEPVVEQVTSANDTATASVRIAHPPDLLADSLVFANPHPPAGDPVGVAVHVRNAGEADAESAVVALYHRPPERDETILATWVRTLHGGGGAVVETVFATAAQPGIHRFRAVLDPDDAIPESDESNNGVIDSVMVSSGADLLCATGLSFSLPVLTRDTVAVSATIRNAGESEAGSFELSWEADWLTFLSGDAAIGELTGMSDHAVHAQFAAPDQPGVGLMRLIVDSSDSVEETNETNNTAEASVTVLAEPDLSVRSEEIRFDPSAPTEDDTVAVRFIVRNLGEVASAACRVTIAHRAGGSGEWSWMPDVTLPGVEAGGLVEGRVEWIAADSRFTHWFLVTCNPDSSVRERTLANNSGERTVAIAPKDREAPTITLAVALPGFEDSSWVPETVPLAALLADSGSGVDTSSATIRVNAQVSPVTDVAWAAEGQRLRFSCRVGPLPPGDHQVVLEAADRAGNRGSSRTIPVRVAPDQEGLRIIPMHREGQDQTVFLLRCARAEPASLGVYTSTGRLIMRWDLVLSPPMTQVTWDRRDRDGDRAANGVYLVVLTTQSGRDSRTPVSLVR